jgi:hypothetical protein
MMHRFQQTPAINRGYLLPLTQRRKKQQWKTGANEAAAEITRLHEKLLAKGESIASLEARIAVLGTELQLLAAAGTKPALGPAGAATPGERVPSPASGRRPISSRSSSRRPHSGSSALKPVTEDSGVGVGEAGAGVIDMAQLRLQLEEAWGEVDAAGRVCLGLDEEVEQVEAAKQALLVSHWGLKTLAGLGCPFWVIQGRLAQCSF